MVTDTLSRWRKIGLRVLLLSLCVAASSECRRTGEMIQAVSYPAAVLLPDGRVLIVGGQQPSGAATNLTQVFDPASGTFFASTPTLQPHYGHTATMLANEREVLIAGMTVEIRDSKTGAFRVIGNLVVPRSYHTATLLPDGRVLIAGGTNASGVLDSTEIYDPVTVRFTAGPRMAVPRYVHTATRLPNGKVLITGGSGERLASPPISCSGIGTANNAELFNPLTDQFEPLPPMTYRRESHTATLLTDGRVLIAGGYSVCDSVALGVIGHSTEIFDPATGTFTASVALADERLWGAAVRLASGRFMLAGQPSARYSGGGTLAPFSSAEIIDMGLGQSIAEMPMSGVYNAGMQPVSLGNGDVLFAGGGTTTAETCTERTLAQVSLKGEKTRATPAESVQYTVSVRAALPLMTLIAPGGTISLRDGATEIKSFSIGGSPMEYKGQFAAGPHALSAFYSGDGAFDPAVSSTLGLFAGKYSSVVSLSSSHNPAHAGENFVISAKISADEASLPPSGSVQFFDGEASLGAATVDAGGAASLTTSLRGGYHTLTAKYPGDANFLAANSSGVLQKIGDFSLSPDGSSAVSVTPGQTATIPFWLSSLGEFQEMVTFSCSGAPPQSICTAPPPASPSVVRSVPLELKLATTARNATLGSAGTKFRPVQAIVALLAFCVVLGSGVVPGRERWSRAALALLVMALLISCGDVRHRIPVGTPAGIYTVTVTGTSAELTHSVDFTVTVP